MDQKPTYQALERRLIQLEQEVRPLRESERNYRQLFDATNDAILIHHAQTGAILDVNRTMLEMYGYTYEEALQLTIDDLSSGEPPYSENEARQLVKQTVEQGPQVFEWQAKKKDGKLFWVEVALRSSEIGGETRVLALVRDITERKQAEAEREQLITEMTTKNLALAYQQELHRRLSTQLRTAADISKQLTAILEPDLLLNQIVTLLQLRFNLYHVHVYLLDAASGMLLMQAGSGEVGQMLRQQKHRIPFELSHSLVARAARERTILVVNDVQLEPDFLPNPLLPETRSEVSVPLLTYDRLIGVLDIQANKVAAFTQADLDTFNILAGQIAIALHNAALFAEQKQTEAGLRESEERYRQLVDLLPDAVVVHRDGKIVFANPAGVSLVGAASADQIVGRPVLDFVPPDQMELIKQRIRQRSIEGRVAPFIEEKFIRFDGSMIDVEMAGIPFSSRGKTAVQVVFRDITKRKQAEEALKLDEVRLNSLLELSQQAAQLTEKEIVQLGLEQAVRLTGSRIGYFHFVNDDQETLELHAWSEATLRECQAVYDKHYPISLAGVWADCARLQKPVVHNDYQNLPARRSLPEGHSILVRHLSVPVMDEGKVRVVAGVGNKETDYDEADVRQLQLVANDIWKIVERKRAEAEREALIQELEAKNSELERFTYTVSHDLKSPLVTIRGFLGLLEKDMARGDAERVARDLKFIYDATDKMQLLLNDLLELSRIGRLVNPPEEVSLNELARQAADLVAVQIARRGVQLQIAPNLPTVYGDRPRLLEVFQNLIDNAVKFMGNQPAPRLEIGCWQLDQETVCYVRDNGIGIEPRFHDKIFGLFERLDPALDGTGIGLALVKRIIEMHGGRIWIESDGIGTGATFHFTLPVVKGS